MRDGKELTGGGSGGRELPEPEDTGVEQLVHRIDDMRDAAEYQRRPQARQSEGGGKRRGRHERGGCRLEPSADAPGEHRRTIGVPTNFPSNAVHYDDEEPLFVADSIAGRDRFTVQVLNHLAEADNQVAVRFDVVEGAGSLADPQPLETANDPTVQDDGLASTRLRADLNASQTNGGRIVVTAHAPGYEGSPVRFVAQAVPGVRIETESVPIERALIDLGFTDGDNHPIVVEDFDGDGLADIATIAGVTSHRLLLAYRQANGWSIHVSDEIDGQVRSMTTAALAPGTRSLVLSVSDFAVRFGSTPFGNTYIIQDPRLEIIEVKNRPATESFVANPIVVRTESGNPMTKAAIAMDAQDIDGDGIDEIALSRCSYIFLVNLSQQPDVECNARLSDKTDSELALLRVTPGNPPTLAFVASLLSEGNDGGFRDVKLVDVDGDGSLDLVSAASSIAVGVCGRAGMPQSGFGFNDAPRFFTTITFGQGWSVASGRFNDDPFTDLIVTGAVRSSSPNSGLKLVPGGPCAFSDGPNPLIVGPKTAARWMVVRSADFNGDGWSDAVLLHRQLRELQLYLGGGRFGSPPRHCPPRHGR